MKGVFTRDILDFMRALEHHRVRYLLIGGYAVTFHGHSRYTADIDFAYAVDPANAARLFLALQEFWGGDVPNVASVADLLDRGMIFQFGVKPNRIDLLSEVAGIDFDTAWDRRVIARIDEHDLTVSIIGLHDLRLSKAAAGRLKDLDDLANLPTPG